MHRIGYALICLCNIITSKVALILGLIQNSFQFICKVLNDTGPGYLQDFFFSVVFAYPMRLHKSSVLCKDLSFEAMGYLNFIFLYLPSECASHLSFRWLQPHWPTNKPWKANFSVLCWARITHEPIQWWKCMLYWQPWQHVILLFTYFSLT